MSNNQHHSNENKQIYCIPEYQLYLSNDTSDTDLPAVLATSRFKSINHDPVKGKIKIKYIGKNNILQYKDIL